MAVVFKSYEIVLIRVFLHAAFISAPRSVPKSMVFEKYAKNGKILHAELISALKTEPKSMVFEKYAKNGKILFIIIIFYLLRFLYKSFN